MKSEAPTIASIARATRSESASGVSPSYARKAALDASIKINSARGVPDARTAHAAALASSARLSAEADAGHWIPGSHREKLDLRRLESAVSLLSSRLYWNRCPCYSS